MTGSRKEPSDNGVRQRKGRPSLRNITINKLASIQLGDKVAYRDPMGRERAGVVSQLVARGVVMVRVAGEVGEQRITARNFVRIEARSARSIPEREES